jgi:hypothetical protein
MQGNDVMDLMATMDLQAAVIAHLNWKSKLVDFFYGVEDLSTANVPDHTTCDLGKWLYSKGMTVLADFSELNAMVALHKEVHDEIKTLIAMPKEKRMTDEGRQILAQFKEKCDRLVAMLEGMEAKVKR